MWKEQGSGGGGGQGPRGEAGASLESKNRVNARETLHTGKEQRQARRGISPLAADEAGGAGEGARGSAVPGARSRGEPGRTALCLGVAGGQRLLAADVA